MGRGLGGNGPATPGDDRRLSSLATLKGSIVGEPDSDWSGIEVIVPNAGPVASAGRVTELLEFG